MDSQIARSSFHRLFRLHRPGDGLFSIQEFGKTFNCLFGLFHFVLIIGPQLLTIICLIYGYLMTAIEDWPSDTGPFWATYILGFLPNPISNVQMATEQGKVVALLNVCFVYVMCNTLLGLTGLLGGVQLLSDALSGKRIVLFVFLIAPAALILFCAIASIVISMMDGLAFKVALADIIDWVTVGGNLSLAPLTYPSVDYIFVKHYVSVASVTFCGVILGIVGAHPYCSELIVFLEGDFSAANDAEEEAGGIEDKSEDAAMAVPVIDSSQEVEAGRGDVALEMDRANLEELAKAREESQSWTLHACKVEAQLAEAREHNSRVEAQLQESQSKLAKSKERLSLAEEEITKLSGQLQEGLAEVRSLMATMPPIDAPLRSETLQQTSPAEQPGDAAVQSLTPGYQEAFQEHVQYLGQLSSEMATLKSRMSCALKQRTV